MRRCLAIAFTTDLQRVTCCDREDLGALTVGLGADPQRFLFTLAAQLPGQTAEALLHARVDA